MTEETMNRFRNRFLILAIGLAALSAASSRAQAQGVCTSCSYPEYRCTLVVGPGWLKCKNITNGCELTGACEITKNTTRPGFSAEGSLLASAWNASRETAQSLKVSLASSTSSSLANATYERVCDGFVVQRHYSQELAAKMRKLTAQITL